MGGASIIVTEFGHGNNKNFLGNVIFLTQLKTGRSRIRAYWVVRTFVSRYVKHMAINLSRCGCVTVCTGISQDLDGYRYVSRYVCVLVRTQTFHGLFTVRLAICARRDASGSGLRQGSRYVSTICFTICLCILRYVCFTICLCISPDLDGNRGTKKWNTVPRETWTICFTICLCISPDLDGKRGTKKETLGPERPIKDPKTQIRSHRTAGASCLVRT
jgi:hypothetical protein